MSTTTATVIILILFLVTILGISIVAARSNKVTPDDFYLANRSLGTVVMLMTTGASYFSTWTLLGAIGSYYREGAWFVAFAAWAVVHAIFIWMFGSRIWYLGRKYNFVTPGDMAEKYYKSPTLRVLFAIVGIVGLVPYMLIQITGGASALTSLTSNDIPYWIGVIIMAVFVGAVVTLSGGRGAAWSDTFMGFFFGFVLIFISVLFIFKSGGTSAFKNIAEFAPEIMVSKGDFSGIFDMAVGLGFGFWIMPHMWQKFYSARSPLVLARTSLAAPFWNSWLMAVGALFIGILAHTQGLVPGLTEANSDQIIPVFFSSYAPLFGAVIVAAVLAAGISTVNSQILSSASLLVTDIYTRFINKDASEKKKTWLGRGTVLGLTLFIVILSFLPGARGYLVPVSSLGFAIGAQLVPAALGPLVWRKATATAAMWSIILSEAALLFVYFGGSPLPLGPAGSGIIVGSITLVVISLLSKEEVPEIQNEFHDTLIDVLYEKPNK